MSTIKNIAIIGAAGSLGKSVLKALIDSHKFNITILTRPNSKSTFLTSESVKVVPVDLDSIAALTTAFKGQDAVVSTVGNTGFQSQNLYIDASVAAGVKRFIPSEFGCDLDNPQVAKLPIFGYKVAVKKHLEEQAAAYPGFSYTNIRNNVFLDWGLQNNVLFQPKSSHPRIFDGGDIPFNATTLETVANAVLGVLSHPEETKNRAVYIRDIMMTQNQILGIAKKLAPERKWEPSYESTQEVSKAADEMLAKGDYSAIKEYLYAAAFGKGYGGDYERTDNWLLGIKGNKTDKDIEVILKPLLV